MRLSIYQILIYQDFTIFTSYTFTEEDLSRVPPWGGAIEGQNKDFNGILNWYLVWKKKHKTSWNQYWSAQRNPLIYLVNTKYSFGFIISLLLGEKTVILLLFDDM